MSPAPDLDLPTIALAHSSARGATRSGPHADAQTTEALLTGRGYEGPMTYATK